MTDPTRCPHCGTMVRLAGRSVCRGVPYEVAPDVFHSPERCRDYLVAERDALLKSTEALAYENVALAAKAGLIDDIPRTLEAAKATLASVTAERDRLRQDCADELSRVALFHLGIELKLERDRDALLAAVEWYAMATDAWWAGDVGDRARAALAAVQANHASRGSRARDRRG